MADNNQTTPNANPDGAEQQNQGAAVLDDLEALRARAEERDQFLDLLQRTRADFENYQKRVQRDLAEERRYAQKPLALDLLSALDNLERATAAAQQAGEKGPLVQGVAMVHSQLLDTLRRHGVTRVEAVGLPFDPHVHEAVMQEPSADVPPNTVTRVLENGYQLHDRLLRSAKVVISKPA